MKDSCDTEPGTSTPDAAAAVVRQRFVGGRDVTHWATPVGKRLARWNHRVSGWIGPHRALLLTLGIGGGLAVGLSYATSRIYDGVAGSDGIAALDVPIQKAAIRFRSPAVDFIAASIAEVFGPVGMPVLTVATSAGLALHRRALSPATLTVAAGTGSLLMTIAGKDIVGRHRPSLRFAVPPFEYSPSFPSGHTLNATAISGVVAYLLVLRQTSGTAQTATIATAAVTAVTVGLSRVLLGAHWFTDVLVGWVLGTGWLSIVITSHRLYLTARRRHPVAPGAGITA